MKMAPTHNIHSTMNEIPQTRTSISSETKHRSEQSTNTLQSVLRGEIPLAYRHLAPSRNIREEFSASTANTSHSQTQLFKQHVLLTGEGDYNRPPSFFGQESERFIPTSLSDATSCVVQGLVTSPRPHERIVSPLIESKSAIYGSQYHDGSPSSAQFYDRCSPAYDTRSSPFRESGSPFINQNSSPYHPSSSPYHSVGSPFRSCSPHRFSDSPFYSPQSPLDCQHSPLSQDRYSSADIQESFICDEQPMDLSCKSDTDGHSPAYEPGIADTQNSSSDGSMLRNLLSFGKQRHSGSKHSGSDRDSPCSDVYKPEVVVTSSTRVTLAKKMVYPITSRVSDWLVKIVQFTNSIPEFSSMSQNDKMTLLINSWTRLLLLLMVENEFEFAVTPIPADKQSTDTPPSQEEPTMKSVEGVQSFIKKCRNMSLDQKEYALLRMAVLFNAGYVGLDNPGLVEKLNSAVQQLLQQHIAATRPGDAMHYSRTLMCLPSLYGINCSMVENLFCTRINSNMDMEVLLKEMLQNL